MQARRFKISSIAFAFCAVIAFALFGVVARAADDYTFTLTVKATNSTDALIAADVETANVVVDVYKVADGRYGSDEGGDGYDRYEYINWGTYGFSSVQSLYETVAANRESKASDWATVYEAAAKVVADSNGAITPVVTGAHVTGTSAADVVLTSKGLYLVLARGADEDLGSGKAYSARLEYEFPPTMVAAPTKAANADGVIYTDTNNGGWLDAATILLKSSAKPIFGRLQINKSVTSYKGDEVTFTFHAYDKQTGGSVYDAYGSIYLDGTSDSGSTELTHIPAGITVVVDEDYKGGRYRLATAQGVEAEIVSNHAADKSDSDSVVPASVSFVNEPNGNNPDGGHGIQNHFDNTAGTWPSPTDPTVTPASKYSGE